MDKKIIEKTYKNNNFKLLEENYSKENLNQIPHLIISEQLKINNPIEITTWLFKNGIDYNAKDKLGNTGLMIACFMKNKDFVKLYLSLDIDTNPDEGLTPLMLSLEGLVDEEIVELLLEKNSDVDKITTYNETEISAISIAYQNINTKLFEKLVKESKNIIKHYKIIKNSPKFNTKKANKNILDIAYNDYINSFYEKEPLKSLKDLINKYELKKLIDSVILNDELKKIKCINKKNKEYLYEDKKTRIYFIKENEKIKFIDILINEEIIYPEIKKERIKKQKELNDKIKEYNNSFKINIGYKRELDNKEIKKVEEITEEPKKVTSKKTNNNSFYNESIEGPINFNGFGNYIFEYLNENDFRKKERSVRKYNMLAYKKLTFSYYPELRKGNFLGEEISRNAKNQTISFELKLPTDELFQKVHGQIILHYTVYAKNNIILLTNITPAGILNEGHKADLSTYKGVMISKSNPEKDIFKINLLNMLGK